MRICGKYVYSTKEIPISFASAVRLRINHLVSPEPHLQLSTQQVPSLNPIQTSHLNRPPQSSIAVKDTSITSPSVVARDERSQSLRPLTIHRICERRLS